MKGRAKRCGNAMALMLAVLLLSSCAKPPLPAPTPETSLKPLAGWDRVVARDDQDFRDLALAARQSLEYYGKVPPDTSFLFGPDRVTALDLVSSLQSLVQIIENPALSPAMKGERIRQDFTLYRAAGSDGQGRVLFTGYYEPLLSCRVASDAMFRFPLYRKPDDIIEVDLSQFGNDFPRSRIFGRLENRRLVPYFTRDEIDGKKALGSRDLEILWCSDLIDVYVLQVQGSGKVDLGDGTIISVLYDGANGRPYRSIGRYLIDSGAMPRENMSMQAIREYLRSHPDRIREVFAQNPSYVFFRIDSGPAIGNIGVPLTPGRSIATDNRYFPKGAPALITAQKPVIENGIIKEWVPFTRFVLNQDTGGAIKGAGRVDLFFGPGPEAELAAGNLQHDGELYFLLRKGGPGKK